MYCFTLSLTSARRCGCLINGTSWSLYPPERPGTQLYRRLGGTQSRSGRVQKISPPTGILSPDPPARSESLYRLSYPGLPYTYDFSRKKREVCTSVLYHFGIVPAVLRYCLQIRMCTVVMSYLIQRLGYRLDGPGFESRYGQEIFLLSRTSRQFIQPPTQ
jgi:hypothetical protein